MTDMYTKLKEHEQSLPTPFTLTVRFQSEEVLKHFMTAMCEGVEQDYWEWVDDKTKWKDPNLKGYSLHPTILYDFQNQEMKFVHHNEKVCKELGFN